MSRESLKIGLLGWGNAGKFFHVPFIHAVPGLELVSVVTSQAEARDRLPNVRVLSSIEEVFDDPQIDIVVVATPHRLHMPHARAALEAGKDVIIEKPVAQSAAEARDLFSFAASNDRRVMVFQNRRWDGDFLTVRHLLDSGALGDVYYFESHWALYLPNLRGVWREEPDEIGGVLYDLGPHMIDHAVQLFGKPETVYAQISTHRPGNRVDDMFRIHLHYATGLDVVLVVDFMAPIAGPRFHIRGTKGSFEKHGLDPQEKALRAGQLPSTDTWGTDDSANWGHLYINDFAGSGLTFDGKIRTLRGDYRTFYEISP